MTPNRIDFCLSTFSVKCWQEDNGSPGVKAHASCESCHMQLMVPHTVRVLVINNFGSTSIVTSILTGRFWSFHPKVLSMSIWRCRQASISSQGCHSSRKRSATIVQCTQNSKLSW